MTSPFNVQSVIGNPEHIALLSKYLDERALEPEDFPEGLVPLNNRKLLADRGYNASLAAGRPYIFLQYLDPHGNPYYKEGQTDPYQLARFLGPKVTWTGKDEPPKVIAPNNRPNVLHFEPIAPLDGEERDWYKLPDGQVVLHLESMIKARAAHKWTGFPSIGYNGVNSYSSSKRGVELIHSQYDVDFTRMCHVIVFDSNVTKPEVEKARLGLMFKLKNVLGCKDVRYIDLPMGPNGHWGPDDFLVANGNEALIELIRNATPYVGEEHDDLVAKIQERAVYCTRSSLIIDRQDKVVRSEQKAQSFYAPINKKVLKGKAVSTVYGFTLWRESRDRREVVGPGYQYLGEEWITRDDGAYYNLYQPSGPWPKGDEGWGAKASIVVGRLSEMMTEHDLELLRSYLKFLKFSGGKPTSFPVLFSDKRGVGKGWFSKLAYRLIGAANAASADAKSFVSNFNAQLANRRLVIINEFKVSNAEKASAMNALKRFFGDEFIVIEPKGVDPYPLENAAGMIVTCNALEDIPSDGLEDRRMWYIDCGLGPNLSEAEWSALHAALDDVNVMNEVFRWVEEGEDVNFSTWKPPLDETKVRAVMAASGSLDGACYEVLHALRDHEDNIVALDYRVVVELVKEEYPPVQQMAVRTVTNALKAVGWARSEKRIGKVAKELRHFWHVKPNDLEKLTSPEALAEVDRCNKAVTLSSTKY